MGRHSIFYRPDEGHGESLSAHEKYLLFRTLENCMLPINVVN